jgi:DNA-binding NtrC family response regulator
MVASPGDARNSVLIIDDDEMIAGALHQCLVEAGIAVDVATDPERAAARLRERRYDLVLMDTYMTGQLHGRGDDFLDEVQRLRGQAHLIILTAYGAAQLTDRFREEPGVTVVRKPMPVQFIAALVGGLLPGEPSNTKQRSVP